jgi:GNAT superfamily N-acetyltransferase
LGAARVREAEKSDAKSFLKLVVTFARFENLKPPDAAGQRRLVEDIFVKKRLRLLLAEDLKEIVGYALYFFTYSSFAASPILYLEDLFVVESQRGKGTGFDLFRRCVEEAVRNGCCRMEWQVLTWNRKAMDFYEGLGAERMDLYVYRLDRSSLGKVPRRIG